MRSHFSHMMPTRTGMDREYIRHGRRACSCDRNNPFWRCRHEGKISGILVFALWYWKLDAGGPLGRDNSRRKIASAFLFPQLSTDREHYDGWSPHFLDYLFVAFNTSTAFSPTDTAVLSRWAKLATMLQSLISLSILVLLAARAVNIF
jgi:uncharacterized membrane protein